MKRIVRIAVLVLVMACLFLQVVGAANEGVAGKGTPVTNPSFLGNGDPTTGGSPWSVTVLEDEELEEIDDALKEEIEEDDVVEELDGGYTSPATGVGSAAVIACVSAAGLAVAALTKKREQ